MQHFVAVAGGVTREIFLATCLATNIARQQKLQEKLPRVTWAYETKLARELKGHFLLNEHSDLYFFCIILMK